MVGSMLKILFSFSRFQSERNENRFLDDFRRSLNSLNSDIGNFKCSKKGRPLESQDL